MTSLGNRPFIISHLIIPLLLITPILIGFEFTNWDVDFQRLLYNADTHTWIVSKRNWAEEYLHDKAKIVTCIYATLCIAGLVLSFFKNKFIPFKKDFLFLVLAIILATGIVTSLKQVTNVWCPSQTTLFGGQYTYVKVFEPRIPTDKKGICWPAGHSSAGFAFVSAYFIVRRRWPRYAVPTLVGGLGMGALYGGVRMAQGLHFLSHTLWAGIICWVIMVVLSLVIFKEGPSPSEEAAQS